MRIIAFLLLCSCSFAATPEEVILIASSKAKWLISQRKALPDKPPNVILNNFRTGSAAESTRPRYPRALFFMADWCGPCHIALDGPEGLIEWLSKSGWMIGDSIRSHVQIVNIDVPNSDPRVEAIRTSKISSMPSMVLLTADSETDPVEYNGRQSLLDLFPKQVSVTSSKPAGDASAPTPYAEVSRVLGLLPKPAIGFVDFGCGADARWCILAAEKWGCRVTGIEIDHDRAEAARGRVKAAGLENLVTIIEGDAVTTDVEADVGVAYLYHDVLEKLRPRLEKLTAFASYLHQPPGLPVVKNGDSWIYTRAARVTSQTRMAVWGGQLYSGPVCGDPHCRMCQSIRSQIGQ